MDAPDPDSEEFPGVDVIVDKSKAAIKKKWPSDVELRACMGSCPPWLCKNISPGLWLAKIWPTPVDSFFGKKREHHTK